MKVICIDEKSVFETSLMPLLKKGNLYHVIDERAFINHRTAKGKAEDGVYYILIEIGNRYCYHSSLFVKINETEIDETELVNDNFLTEKV